ncbi:MAG: sigma-70 family RNA polymerase sigma factor [Chloroflexi bacterium]|nr:MAG: sigma-70 family RNA polymerase sigma factor [Chloroflexota bacterium]
MITQTHFTSPIVTESQISDASLVLACRRGEAEAWNVLVNRYQRLIYTIPRRAGLDEDQAAEVFQRTFAKLLQYLDRIKQPESIQAWLVTTARRETLQLIREQRSELSLSQTDMLEYGPNNEAILDDNPLPDETLEHLEEQHLIRRAIAAMDERSRGLLNLLYYQPVPLSYAQIAVILDMPEGSVGPTRARCLEKLRRLLERGGF